MTTPIYRLLPVVAAWWVVSKVTCTKYDGYMTCGSGSERYGRHYRYNPSLPCDLSKDNFCDSPGNQYPWSSVRRFVYENQGLMKRMYGNQRHYNVLRSELVNEMFEEMFDEMPKRQHHRSHPPPSPSVSSSPSSSPSGSRTARYHTVSSVNSLNAKNIAKSGKANAAASSERHQKSRSMKVTTEPEYRRPQTTSSTSKPKFQEKSTGNKLKTGPHLSFHASNRPQLPSENSKNEVRRTNTRRPQQPSTTDTTSPSSGVITTSLEDAPTSTSEEQWLDPDEDYLSFENAEETLMEDDIHSTFFPPPSLDGDIELFEEDYWTTVDDIFTDSTTPYTSTHHDDIVDTFSTVPLPEMTTAASPAHQIHDDPENVDTYFEDFISSPSDNDDDVATFSAPETVKVLVAEGSQSQTKVFPESSHSNSSEPGSIEENIVQGREEELALENDKNSVQNGEEHPELREDVPKEGVVHRDVLEDFRGQEIKKETVKLTRPVRGMNACPVKEEFIAPYWANNTRGETLALVNIYPFEQYVQWERCMYEHRQMYCRKGCRCEQQYRLQRLLAFDPTNECRGIFSDWFRLPSCCVCKCYDLPQDILTASARRPRYETEEDYDLDSLEDVDVHDLEDFVNDDEENDKNTDFDEAGENDDYRDPEEERQLYRVRSEVRLVNIPPQRRPRPQPRPASHIPPPSHSSSLSLSLGDNKMSTPSPQPEPPSIRPTLGTLDAFTPSYFADVYNIAHHARVLYAKSQPFPLSRIPRSAGNAEN